MSKDTTPVNEPLCADLDFDEVEAWIAAEREKNGYRYAAALAGTVRFGRLPS
jgi:hypothetical protein